jgi:hypothetical protein
VAIHIPKRIMINQIYADLIQDYRSPEMGGAILAIFRFYVKDCKNNTAIIASKYKEKYNEQIMKPLKAGKPIDYANTLHFQRRLVFHFYWHMALFRYEQYFSRLSTKKLKLWFTPNEVKLLAILLHMVEPAEAVFEKANDDLKPPESKAPANQMIHLINKLYNEVKYWE